MAASAPLRLISPSSSPRPSRDPSPRPVSPLHAWLPRRRRQFPAVRCASLSPPPPSLDLPLLPFQPAEVRSSDGIEFIWMFRFELKSVLYFCSLPLLTLMSIIRQSWWPIEYNGWISFSSWKINLLAKRGGFGN
jgi:hypothetical protein